MYTNPSKNRDCSAILFQFITAIYMCVCDAVSVMACVYLYNTYSYRKITGDKYTIWSSFSRTLLCSLYHYVVMVIGAQRGDIRLIRTAVRPYNRGAELNCLRNLYGRVD